MSLIELFRIGLCPALFIIFIAWALHFPSKRVFYGLFTFEIVLISLLSLSEFQTQKTAGTSGWLLMYALVLQFFIFFTLMLSRIILWKEQK